MLCAWASAAGGTRRATRVLLGAPDDLWRKRDPYCSLRAHGADLGRDLAADEARRRGRAADLPRRRALPPCRLVLPRDCACTRPAVARSSLRADSRHLAAHHPRLLWPSALRRGEPAARNIGDRQPGPDADLPRCDRTLLWAGADHQEPRRR